MSYVYHTRAAQFAAALTVALISSQAPAYAFAPCTYTSSAPQTLEIQSVRSIGTTLMLKKRLDMISSFAEAEGVSKRMPVFVDFEHDDLDRTKFASFQLTNCPDDGRHCLDTSLSAITESPSDPPFSKEVLVARLLLLLSAALYGTNFTMVKSLDESLSVGISSTLRFGFAALCMLPWLLAPIDDQLKSITKEKFERCKSDMAKWEEPTRWAAGLAGMEIGVYNSIGYISQAIGLKTIPANKSAFICSMAVVTVPILDFLFGKELLKRQVIGACLAAIGVYALEMGGQDAASLSSGDLVSLVQPLMFGLGFWRMETAMEKYPTEAGRLAAAQLLMVFIVSLSYLICGAPFTDTCEVLPSVSELIAWFHDPNIVGMLVWTGLITTAFTIWMETLALKTLSAAETTLIFSTEPLFGAAFAAAVAGECLGREAGIGAACIIGGCLVSGLDLDAQIKKLLPRYSTVYILPMRFLLATKSSTALALISSSKPYIPHRTRIRTPTRAAMSSEQAGTNNYVDAGANLLDSMYQGMYHGKPRHEPDLDLVLQRSYDSGIRQIISLAGTTKESVELQEFISKLDNADCKEKVKVFGTVGIHPTRCAEEFAEKISENADGLCEWIPKTEQQQKEIIQKLISIANTGKISGNVVAIGEFGLDYERLQFTPKDIQQIGLRAQLEVATETKLPLYLHNRASGEDLYSILSEYKERLQFDKDYHGIRGIVHSFDESLDIATQFISLGLYIGINGCSLKTPENLEMVKGIPLESIILETDCPWCDIRPTHASYSHIKTTFPSKKEKQYNRDTSKEFCVKNRTEPCHVLQVAEVIAGVKMLEVSKVLETCCRNVFQLFGDLARS